MLNRVPMYLKETTNKKIADLFKAKTGISLTSGRTVYSGIMVNIYEDGTVATTDGITLFKMSNIVNVFSPYQEYLRIDTQNSIYEFCGA